MNIPENQEERALFLLGKAVEALNSAQRSTQEKRFPVARRDAQYGAEFLALAHKELADLAEKR